MKKLIYIAALLFSALIFADTAPYSGEISRDDLLKDYAAFSEQYNEYTPSEEELTTIKTLQGKQVLVFLGTWCHDSKREVPRFLKLLDTAKVQLGSLKLVAVGYDKLDPAGLAKQHDLLYTPTIIVLDGEKELTRMIEKPKQSLAVDLTQPGQTL
ncbi:MULTISPECIES: TlpA family protein disulfide reductase [Pseudoalteromonas]|jgi:thiol-disulfide isomerase/thioredoxin|uniref:TlpA family protein disulfide reductase n=1 Tax=Pseudoalteromonas sp. S4492 TaxID=579560 RepID=UPI00110AA229|nr:thioredoxin [Pseudoalteromonas sp. S4492]TMO28609.1 thioredoxin [Pseudoalteromonas sp. S4492]